MVFSELFSIFAGKTGNQTMAKYIKQEIPDLNGTGRTQAYYKMKLRPMPHQQFVSMCAKGGTLDESTLLAALSRISDRLALFMAEGFSVKLDGIGTFHAKLGVMSDKEPDAFEEGEQKRNAKSIHVTGVSYKTDPQIVREMRRTCVLEKGGESRIRKPKLTLEERIEKAREFLKKNMFMKVPDYVALTGLSRTTATTELRKLAHNPSSGITFRGRGSQKYYVLREKE